MRLILMTAAIALISAGSASAGEPAAERQAPTRAETQPTMLKCIDEPMTGSRTRAYRICLTEAQWARRSVTQREKLEKLRSSHGTTSASLF